MSRSTPGTAGPHADSNESGTFVFFHAHPDDEAIFTGGTIALLSNAGHRCVVVYATSGELGRGAGADLGQVRQDEARRACEHLGAHRVIVLDHHDSGLDTDPYRQPWGAFAGTPVEVAAGRLADIVAHESAAALVTYDSAGIYGHPDHVHAHRVGAAAARRAGLSTWYEVTVDREYLHFVDAHVAAAAGESVRSAGGMGSLGSATVEITTTVDVRPVLHRKYDAIAAHRSQVPDDPSFGTGDGFADVYGYEWFIRHGERAAIDRLADATYATSVA